MEAGEVQIKHVTQRGKDEASGQACVSMKQRRNIICFQKTVISQSHGAVGNQARAEVCQNEGDAY